MSHYVRCDTREGRPVYPIGDWSVRGLWGQLFPGRCLMLSSGDRSGTHDINPRFAPLNTNPDSRAPACMASKLVIAGRRSPALIQNIKTINAAKYPDSNLTTTEIVRNNVKSSTPFVEREAVKRRPAVKHKGHTISPKLKLALPPARRIAASHFKFPAKAKQKGQEQTTNIYAFGLPSTYSLAPQPPYPGLNGAEDKKGQEANRLVFKLTNSRNLDQKLPRPTTSTATRRMTTNVSTDLNNKQNTLGKMESGSSSSSSSTSSGSDSSSNSSDSETANTGPSPNPQTRQATAPKLTSPDSPGAPADTSNTSESFHTADEFEDDLDQGEGNRQWNLISLSVPPKLTFFPPPRRLIKDPRYQGYRNMDFNFEKEWNRLYSSEFITPLIPLVQRRNKTKGEYDPRQLATAPARVQTMEQSTRQSTPILKTIMSNITATHAQVIAPEDLKRRPKGSINTPRKEHQALKFNPTFLKQQAKHCQPTPKHQKPRSAHTSSKQRAIPLVNSGIQKQKLVFLPSRAPKFRYTTLKFQSQNLSQQYITNNKQLTSNPDVFTISDRNNSQTQPRPPKTEINQPSKRQQSRPEQHQPRPEHNHPPPPKDLFTNLVPLARPTDPEKTASTVPRQTSQATKNQREPTSSREVSNPSIFKREPTSSREVSSPSILHATTTNNLDAPATLQKKQHHHTGGQRSKVVHHAPADSHTTTKAQQPRVPQTVPNTSTRIDGDRSERIKDTLEQLLEVIFNSDDEQVEENKSSMSDPNAKTPSPMETGPAAKNARMDISAKYQAKSDVKKAKPGSKPNTTQSEAEEEYEIQ